MISHHDLSKWTILSSKFPKKERELIKSRVASLTIKRISDEDWSMHTKKNYKPMQLDRLKQRNPTIYEILARK